jgi:hypothetical protein
MNFKPTKLKMIISIAVIVIWYALIFLVNKMMVCDCLPYTGQCPGVFDFSFFPHNSCDCGCYSKTFLELIGQLLIILAPGILFYIIRSFVEKKEVGGKKKK